MRPLRYSINVTLDGCCDHRAIVPDEDLHRHAVENLERADALLLRRVTYQIRLVLRLLVIPLFYAALPTPALLGQAPAFACPASIDFGTAPVGQFTLRAIWCTNMQTVPVFFDYGGTSGYEDFELNPCVGGTCYDSFPMVIPPGGRFGIMVAFHPVELGSRSGSTTILNDAGLPSSVIAFTGLGGNVAVPMLDKLAALILGASLAIVAIFVILRGGGRVA